MTRASLRILLVGLVLAAACRIDEKEPEPEKPEPDPMAPVTLAPDDATVELVYADLSARFRTARGIDAVPVASREVVRVVTGPTASGAHPGDDDLVHVVDLTRPGDGGRFETELETAFEFEVRALASLPPGDASRIQIRSVERATPIEPRDGVIVYGTTDCGATEVARDYLRERGIDHDFVDVANDPRGADDLAMKAAGIGFRVDRTPVIDVRGRLLVGFDERRVRALLGDRL